MYNSILLLIVKMEGPGVIIFVLLLLFSLPGLTKQWEPGGDRWGERLPCSEKGYNISF